MLTTIGFLILIIVVIGLIIRPLTTFVHELGHALPVIFMSGKGATIYIGSYGDPENSYHFHIGKLEVWFRYNPFQWDSGLCVSQAQGLTLNQQIIFTLTGPIASFILSIAIAIVVFSYDLSTLWQFISVMFIASGWIDLYSNLIIMPNPIVLHDGSITFNDGYTLNQLFLQKRHPQYSKAIEQCYEENYKEAISSLEVVLSKTKNYHVQRLAFDICMTINDYPKAKVLMDKILKDHMPSSEDYYNAGVVYKELGHEKEMLKFYMDALRLNPNSPNALNNYAYQIMEHQMYAEAVPYLERAIQVMPQWGFPYNNLGFAQIHLGLFEEALQNIQHSITLDDTNAYAYRNLGIYYFKKEDYQKALNYFKQAEKTESGIPLLDEYLKKTSEKF